MKTQYKLLTVIALVIIYRLGLQLGENNMERAWESGRATPYEDASFLDYNRKMGGIAGDSPSGKYGIVVSTSRHNGYAKEKASLCAEAGFRPEIVRFGNGFESVVIYASDDLDDALSEMEALKREEICPADGWILTAQ